MPLTRDEVVVSASERAIGASGEPASFSTAQECYDAARAEGLTLKPQSARERPGHRTESKKKHETGHGMRKDSENTLREGYSVQTEQKR